VIEVSHHHLCVDDGIDVAAQETAKDTPTQTNHAAAEH
jgi:hypothetical protein